jgi:SAM-dependent methyltransferase
MLGKAARGICAPAILVILPCVWIIQLVLFTPFLFLALFLPRRTRRFQEPTPSNNGYRPQQFVFDRLFDVSKLYGCNTRNVRYRWTIFLEAVQVIKNRVARDRSLVALDFGAGSLRDTYELARLGFRVTANDLNADAVQEGIKFYDWSTVSHRPSITIGPLAGHGAAERYDMITAFDVIEHLDFPEEVLRIFRERLEGDGMILVTVPNRRSLWERIYRRAHKRRQKRGLVHEIPGMPHVQFRTPAEWESFFCAQGFIIYRHDMAIGVLVNDCWAGFYSLLATIFIEPILVRVAAKLDLVYRRRSFQELFYPSRLMDLVDRLDVALKPVLHHWWGWNLFVLKKS